MSNKFREGVERLVGHLETDTGTILLTDGIWNSEIPSANQERVHLNLGTKGISIPVYGVIRHGKRYLILDIDQGIKREAPGDRVEVEDVTLPAEEPGPSFEDQEIALGMSDFPRTPDGEEESE